MKIELTMQLDIPAGEIDGFSEAEIRQMLFDNVQNRLEVSYRVAAVETAASQVISPEAKSQMLGIYETWADIIHNATWAYTKVPTASEKERQELRERFRKVIIGAGYTEGAAESILAEYLDKYLTNIPEFVKMLEEYESGKHHDD